jgi:ribosomal protein RSM22 (predicted rRNA methylase)
MSLWFDKTLEGSKAKTMEEAVEEIKEAEFRRNNLQVSRCSKFELVVLPDKIRRSKRAQAVTDWVIDWQFCTSEGTCIVFLERRRPKVWRFIGFYSRY